MSCSCLSPRKKERAHTFPPLRTNLASPPRPQPGIALEPVSPYLKLSRLTLLSRIERVFNPLQTETDKIELPLPIRPESVLVYPLSPSSSTNESTFGREKTFKTSVTLSDVLPNRSDAMTQQLHKRHSSLPRKLNLDALAEPRASTVSLITQRNTRNSQYATVFETPRHEFQPPISPEPTPKSSGSNSSFEQNFQPPVGYAASVQSMRSVSTASATQYATMLRPRLAEQTPPPTPPPTVPLPPIPLPAASIKGCPPRPSSLFPYVNRGGRPMYLNANHTNSSTLGRREVVPPGGRPRSKSSPLRSEVTGSDISMGEPTIRQVRFLTPPPASTSDLRTSCQTATTDGEDAHIPIALFECSYSPPPPPVDIPTFAKSLSISSTQSYPGEVLL